MIKFVDDNKTIHLSDYENYALLSMKVHDFRREANEKLKVLEGRTLWHISSTAQGGGVAEMLQNIIGLLAEFNVKNKWAVIQTDKQDFFNLTKRLHNFIHGKDGKEISAKEREVYDAVNRENAESFIPHVKDGDVLVIHDPQPMGMAKLIKEQRDVKIVWRCHIGLDEINSATRKAWDFLGQFFDDYDHFVFTAPEYIPEKITGNVTIIPPGIDPLSYKNIHLNVNRISNDLINGGLLKSNHPVVSEPFKAKARRILPDGSLGSPFEPEDIGLMFRPIITLVSRWDRLKGWVPLIEAFVNIKKNREKFYNSTDIHNRRIDAVRLVLAGPDPKYVTDDPEGQEVLEELKAVYTSVSPDIAKDIALVMMPMESIKENAWIINSLQSCSSVVVQNSLQEGFGLTATEAMWKRVPVMGSSAVGLRTQIRDEVDGCLVKDPEDIEEVGKKLVYMLNNFKKREIWAFNAQKRVMDEYLIFSQISRWMGVYHKLYTK